MKEEYSKGLEQNLSVMQAISSLTSLSARINDMCGRTRLPEYSAIQTVLKEGAIWDVPKPKWTAIDAAVFLGSGDRYLNHPYSIK